MKLITNLQKRVRNIPGDPGIYLLPYGEALVTDRQIESCGYYFKRVLASGFIKVEDDQDIPEGRPDEPKAVEVKHKGGGKWTVTVGGIQVHEGLLKKQEARDIAAEYGWTP